MKFVLSALILASTSIALAQVPNGIKLSGLPTASKSYLKQTMNESELSSLAEGVKSECLTDKAKAEAFAQKNGFKIISSEGCSVIVSEPIYTIGSSIPGSVSTNFEVLFK